MGCVHMCCASPRHVNGYPAWGISWYVVGVCVDGEVQGARGDEEGDNPLTRSSL